MQLTWEQAAREAGRKKKRAKRVERPEQQLQIACAMLTHHCVPPPPEGPFWTAINPVPAKSRAVAGLSKAMGMRAGVWDFWFLWRGKTLVIEFKADAGRLSAAQIDVGADVELMGGATAVARSVEDYVEILRKFGIPVNATL